MGKIELDHTGSGSGVTLSSDGTDLLLDGTAIGGGGAALELYAENPSSPTAPSATGTNAIAIGDGATSSQTRSIAIGYNSTSSGIASTALGPSANASGFYGTALGYNAKAVSGGFTSVLALGNAYASGSDSFAAAIANNTSTYGATGQESVAIGKQAKATGIGSLAISANRFGPATSTSNGAVAIGDAVTASGSLSLAMGYNTTASASSAIAIGSGITNSTANQVVLGGTTQQVKISDTYTLPTSDGTNGQVLTTDGSGAVTFADAGGGGGSPDLYADNYDGTSTLPSATGGNSVAIGADATASGFNGVAVGKVATASGGASVAMSYSKASGSYSFSAAGGNAQAWGATGYGAVAIGAGTNARADSSVALGASAYTETGSQSVAIGDSYALGSHSLAAAISTNNSSYGALNTNAIAMGNQSKAAGSQSFVAGGYANTANSYRSSVLNGTGNTVNSNFGTILGGESNTINSSCNYSIILCGERNEAGQQYTVASGLRAKTTVKGQWAHSAGHFTTTGDAQSSKYVLRSDTTDATAEALTATNTSGDITNQIILPNNSAYFFSGTCVARESAASGTDMGAWEFKGCIRREANAGTTTLVSSTIDEFSAPTGWSIALSADTTNGGLAVTVTGAASTNIRWVATVHTSEVTYA